MLVDSSDEDKEELLQFMLSSAASARHTVELMMEDMMEDCSDDSGREWGTGSRPGRAKTKARDFKGAYERLFKIIFQRILLLSMMKPILNDDFACLAQFSIVSRNRLLEKDCFARKSRVFPAKKEFILLIA
jgi:hypothetical protein